ncbi:MAG: hypothetical protein B7X93_08875 [Hydrogenophilales bacterium 17-61-9]|nr:MAG: hypothetical protein B7X93_08875 [Hydrogenophilales bacterium 17-61-9]
MAKMTTRKKPVPVDEYMNTSHLGEFKSSLLRMREVCLQDLANAHDDAIEDRVPAPDDVDRSDQRMEMESRARTIERLSYLKREIDSALRRIEEGEFGYCEESGDEIGLPRLRANPLARYTIEVQSRREHMGRLKAVA